MKYTENFALKKPEPNDFYNVEDFNENMDKIEEELDKRPTNEGNASDMTVDFTEATTLTTLTSGEKLKVAFGKIAKAISTLISHIATSATTSVSGHVKFGTASGTACQGNDSRLSNARTPTSHASTGTGYGVGTASNYGHVKLTSSSAVTDTTGLALAATEKNASISGTLANQIADLNTDLNNKTNYPDYISSHRIPIGGERETWFTMPTDGYVQFYYLVTGLSGIADEGVSEYTCGISGFINDGNHPIYTNNFHFTYGYNEEYWSALYPVKKGDTVMFKVLTAKVLQYAEIWLVPYR